MKKLRFRKWVTVTLSIVLMIALLLLTSVEFESIKTEIIFGSTCFLVIVVNAILLNLYS